MQKIHYLILAYSPKNRRLKAAVGLCPEDCTWLFARLGTRGKIEGLIPAEHDAVVYSRIFGEGIPEGCHYYLRKLQKTKGHHQKVPSST